MKKSSKKQFQQGDVWLEKVTSIPADAVAQKTTTLAEGEGHHLHRTATAEGVTLYMKDGIRFASFEKEMTIEHVTPDGRHGEHNPIVLPAGYYQFGQVQEWDYLGEMAREVID
jgi:hypothetical protein